MNTERERAEAPWQLVNLSINRIEELYRDGRITEDDVARYLRDWNAGPHFTQAVLSDGRIRNFDPESKSAAFYSHLFQRYGVRA